MIQPEGLAARFQTDRNRLRAIAYRILGSSADADDAVQEAWLRLARSDANSLANLSGWLTTTVSRICLDLLRSRATRPEEPSGHELPEQDKAEHAESGPEHEALLADASGRALLVVLARLNPAERVAFVLHDVFAVPFNEIASVVDRSPETAKKLASRARLKVRGAPAVPSEQLARHKRVVEQFLTATRHGDLQAVLAVLAPDIVRRADAAALGPGRPGEAHGTHEVANEILAFGHAARFAAPALVNGAVGLVVAPHGVLQLVITVAIADEQITAYELIATPSRLRQLDIAVLEP